VQRSDLLDLSVVLGLSGQHASHLARKRRIVDNAVIPG
jgi:hypothetical protein